MTAVDPAALRELAQGLTVPTIAEAETGTRVVDRKDDTWTALDDGWYSPGCEELSNDELEDLGVSVTHVPLPVEQLAAVRAALEGAAAELERQAVAAADETGRLREELYFRLAERDAAIISNHGVGRERTEARAERDRARDAAAALEAECAELRTALTRVRGKAEASLEEREAEYAASRVDEIAGGRFRTVCTACDSVEIAAAVLARTDPLRADAEGGESRG